METGRVGVAHTAHSEVEHVEGWEDWSCTCAGRAKATTEAK